MLRRVVVALLVGAVAAPAPAADPVPVKGSSASYAQSAGVVVGDKTVKLNLTGVGLRKRVVTVYLHIVMERNVDPDDFIGAFRTAICKTYPEDKFAAEFKQLTDAVGNKAASKGDHVYLVSVPGVGVRVRLADKVDVTIKNPAFARALWEIYLGENPIDDTLKNVVVGMLAR
jgi:hypothetical protein